MYLTTFFFFLIHSVSLTSSHFMPLVCPSFAGISLKFIIALLILIFLIDIAYTLALFYSLPDLRISSHSWFPFSTPEQFLREEEIVHHHCFQTFTALIFWVNTLMMLAMVYQTIKTIKEGKFSLY